MVPVMRLRAVLTESAKILQQVLLDTVSTIPQNQKAEPKLGLFNVPTFRSEKFGTTQIMEEMDFTVGASDTAESFTVTTVIDNNPLVD